jgi:hypothetical protein
MYNDRSFIERKMKHYNTWMMDKNRDPASRYPGFPEEIAFKLAEKEFTEEFLSRQKKRKSRNEEQIKQKA